MSKELVISATPHETRVAILEDGHLCEIYIEREKEFALVGSIYKGRVTRVLPGMQSAFVDIGRDTDAFLYVSDFLENLEDYDHVTADEAKAHAPAASTSTATPSVTAPAVPSTTMAAPAPIEQMGGSGIGILEGETIGRGSGEPTSAPYSQTIGVAPDFDPTAENLAHGSAAIEPSDSAPPQDYVAPIAQPQGNYPPTPARTHSSGQGQHDRPRNDRGFGGGGGRGGRDRGGDRGGNRGGRFRRGGGRDRGGRPQGRDLPASKYASSSGGTRAPYSPHSPAGSFAPRDSHDESSSSAENLPPIILPGESLAKYKERPAVAQSSSPSVADSGAPQTGAMGYEHPEGFGEQTIPTQHSDSELPPATYTKMESVAPPTLDLHIEPAHDSSFPMGREAVQETAQESSAQEIVHEERTEVKDSHDRFANIVAEAESVREEWISSETPRNETPRSVSSTDEDRPGMGLTHGSPADLTDAQARTLAERLVEAKREEAQDEVEDDSALTIGGADFSDAEADAAHDEAHDETASDDAEVNGNVHDESHEDGGHETHDEAADEAHDEAHNANIDAGDPEAIHAAGEFAEPGASEPTSAEQQNADTKFNREPRSARVEDPRRNARFARPQRRSGGGQRGGRPMRHGSRPPERHGRPSSGGHAPQRRPQLISEMLKAGQEIIVQIAKEPLGKKGARITSHVALPGRFLVYMPTVNHIGVSRKISSAETRSRLRSIVGEYKSTFPGGFIVRTAAGNVSDADLRMDIEFLGKTWHEICARSENKKAPALVHRDLNLVERILRDYVSSDYTSIWIDNEEEFSKVVEFVSRFQPDLVSRVKLYTKEAPIFEEFGIQQELDKAMRPKVWLKSGGYIVINHTEALVAIDVNTGKFVGRGSTRLEDTIVKTNLEAVKEIVRQIRLRDLGGIIIVDFIDMEERRNRDKVMHAIDDELRADKAPSKVLSFNEFGLVAITRKRTKQALEKVLCQPCPYCTGSGMVKSIPTICFEIQMEARKMAADLDSASVTLRVHPEIAKALKTRESALVEELESISKKSVIIQSDPTLHWEQYDIY
jgi:Rne/Rng family ribonuclease